MKIKDVNFPKALLNALRDEKLVVFAGAGVSMGPPAGLPSFRELAEEVAEGTGESIAKSETDVNSWGGHKAARVRGATISCHAPTIQCHSSVPRSLLHFFHATDPGRIITTNFHCLLEQKAGSGGEV